MRRKIDGGKKDKVRSMVKERERERERERPRERERAL